MGFVDKFKNLIGIDEEDDYYEEEEMDIKLAKVCRAVPVSSRLTFLPTVISLRSTI